MPHTGLFVTDDAYAASDYDPIQHLPFAEVAHPVCIDGEPAFYHAEDLLGWLSSNRGSSPMTRRKLGINALQPLMTPTRIAQYSDSVQVLKQHGWDRPDVLDADFSHLPSRTDDELQRLKALPVSSLNPWSSASSSSSSSDDDDDMALTALRAIRESCSGVWAATHNPILVRQRRDLLITQQFVVSRNYNVVVERYECYVPLSMPLLAGRRAVMDTIVDMREHATAGIPNSCVLLGAERLFDDICALFAFRYPQGEPITPELMLRLLHDRLPRARIPARPDADYCCFYLRPPPLTELLRLVLIHMSDADRALLCGGYCLWDPIWEGVARRTLDGVFAASAYPVWNVEHLLYSHLDRLINPTRNGLGRWIHRAPDGGNLFRLTWTAHDAEVLHRPTHHRICCEDQDLETMEVAQLDGPIERTLFYAPFAHAYVLR